MYSSDVLSLVLAGGVGDRLRPLTNRRCKPAVPFGGSFRVIDFALMNCASSGLDAPYVLTQYLPDSLRRHFETNWNKGLTRRTLSPKSGTRYAGTADAVFQNSHLLDVHRPEAVLILSGDHVYHADYRKLLEYHLRHRADVTLLTGSVDASEASQFGVLGVSPEGTVTEFVEKPTDSARYSRDGRCAINLGVYCFSPEFLRSRLDEDASDSSSSRDFGKNVLPASVRLGKVLSCPLDRVSTNAPTYWRDVGTLDAFFDANMDLVSSPAMFELADARWSASCSFRSRLPRAFRVSARIGSRVVNGRNLIASTARVISRRVVNSIIAPLARVGRGSVLEECIVFPGARIGEGARLRRVIVEEGVEVAAGTQVGQEPSSTRGHSNGVTVLCGA